MQPARTTVCARHARGAFLNLGRHEICARIQEDSLPECRLSARTLKPDVGMYHQRDAIVAASRASYASHSRKSGRIRGLLRKSPP